MAAFKGKLSIIQWLRSHGCPWHEGTGYGFPRNGDVSALMWVGAIGCSWNESACREATEGGNVCVLRANGCPWDIRTYSGAAYGEHLGVLQWADENGCPSDEETCRFAAEAGQVMLFDGVTRMGITEMRRRAATPLMKGTSMVSSGRAKTVVPGTTGPAPALLSQVIWALFIESGRTTCGVTEGNCWRVLPI